MGKRSRRSVSGRMVSASDLAQMGRCERLVVFEHLYGSRRTARQRHARMRMVLGAIATGLRWWSGLRGGGKCRR
ncbi:MAG: hypothetical protein IPJ50_05060 [Betaproteobacteria bacterium]|nr:hypothetical protein [Betaproteobacteria bacterium]